MKLRLVFGAAVAASAAAALAFAQEAPKAPETKKDEKPKWDVEAPPLPMRKVNINVDEGTWMDVDVSPDGKTLAFDLLGDIYTMPISGGTPTRIAEGLSFEMAAAVLAGWKTYRLHKRSWRRGQYLGDECRRVGQAAADQGAVPPAQRAELEPDGRFIAARKHFTTGRSLGTGEIWVYSIAGGDGLWL